LSIGMVFSTMFALVLATSVEATRIQVHETNQNKFGASCDDLQNSFTSRLAAFQDFLDANPDLDAVSRATEARAMMRTYGILRTLRRARTCSWVVDNDSKELEQARSIVQSFLSRNPCADVARSELEAGASAESGEIELQSVQRAMAILSSDNCESGEPPEETLNFDEDADAQLSNAEDALQDVIEELEDPAGAAFIQMEAGSVRGFFRAMGVAFLMLFLLLACVGTIALIAAFISVIIAHMILPSCGGVPHCYRGMSLYFHALFGGGAAAAVGIAPCAYDLYTQMLPRLQ